MKPKELAILAVIWCVSMVLLGAALRLALRLIEFGWGLV